MNRPEAPRTFGLIIGAMKSGTTSLFQLLAQHPQVSACRVKEPDFFTAADGTHKNLEAYLRLWDWRPGAHRIALEASTSYSKAPWVSGVPGRIAACGPHEFRFIYMLRNPLDRISSQVRHSLFEGWGKPLDEGVPEDAIDYSRYAMQLDLYAECFPEGPFLLVTLEEFHSDPWAVLEKTCQFLALDPSFEFIGVGERKNKGDFYSVSPFLRRMAKNTLVRSVYGKLPENVRHFTRDSLARMGKREGAIGRWRLNLEERAEVHERLSADLERLETHYGVKVREHWTLP